MGRGGAPPGGGGGPGAAAPAAAAEGERLDPTQPGWLARLLEWQRAAPDTDTFWTALRDDLAQDREITVFTDQDGDSSGTIRLPAGASCIDAAYAVHGEAAHACVGVRVNGRLAPLGTRLRDGDTLHLLMDDTGVTGDAGDREGAGDGGDAEDATVSGPDPAWLEHAATPAARIAISRWLAQHPASAAQGDADAAEGRSARPGGRRGHGLAAAAQARGERPAGAAGTGDHEGVGHDGHGSHPSHEGADSEPVALTDLPGAAVRLARCCTPVPPDGVTGFVIRGGTVAVHRTECPTAAHMAATGRTPVPVRWRDGAAPGGYRATVLAEALSRPRLLADLTEVIASQGLGIVSAAVEPPQEHRVRHTYTVELPDPRALSALMRAMRAVPGVYDVYRAQPAVTGAGRD